MTHWRRDGAVVIVTAAANDDDTALWTALRTKLYGVLSLDSSSGSRACALSLVEAYYALAEDRLLALRAATEPLAVVWLEFQASSAAFVAQYVVYHHFRSCGWLLRSGLNYGAHFVLYRGDADAVHSEYIVYTHATGASTPWHVVQTLTRVAEDVKKTVILCEVTEVAAAQQQDETSCLFGHVSETVPVVKTHGHYEIHGQSYELDALLIRYWDTATVDEDCSSFTFAPQPVVPKTPRKKSKASNATLKKIGK